MGRKKPSRDVINIDNLKIDNKIEIDYKKLAVAIMEAQVILENEKLKQQIIQKEEASQRRDKTFGKKDFSNEKRWVIKKAKECINTAILIFRILFIKKEDAKYLSGTNILFQGLTAMFFACIRYGLYIVAVYLIWHGIANNEYVTHSIYSVAAFIYAQIFRLIQFEIERMTDREYLMAIFAAIVSVLSLVISIILR